MIYRTTLFAIILLVLNSCTSNDNDYFGETNLIPFPQNIDVNPGNYTLDANTKFYFCEEAEFAKYIIQESFKTSDLTNDQEANVNFSLNSDLEKEEYTILINKEGIYVEASNEIGFIWAARSLQQMLPAKFDGLKADNKLHLNYVEISDKPKFAWRGSLLDVGRHFMPVEKVKEYIDLLSLHKMNVLHWHLTEDQGWRIEIKAYPKLTEVGAWRKDGKGGKYGGFYTQEQIKDVVKYASERGITVMPEIEFPGHSVATLTAYPELSCTGGPFEVQTNWGVFDDILCAGNEDVFKFSEQVLSEVLDLFPSKYIHIGGDEAPKIRWENCKKCQARMKDENLHDEHDLQSYFITRLETFLIKNDRKLIGWDEIMEGGLAPEATMQVWRDVEYGKKAIKEGHDIVSSPTSHCYLDYAQKQINVKKIYSFNPIPDGISDEEAKHVLGGEGNLWTERIPPARLFYMAFPRITALSEALWTEKKDYDSFYTRLQDMYLKYDEMNVNYGPEGDIMDIEAGLGSNNSFKLQVEPKTEGVSFKYYFDGEENNEIDYKEAIEFKKSTTVFVQAYRNGKKYGETQSMSFVDHKGRLAKITDKNPTTKAYSGNENTLIDGLYASENFRDGKWKGYNGNDLEATLEFETSQELSKVKVSALSNVSSWIFLPTTVEVYISEDAKNFKKVGEKINKDDYQGADDRKEVYEINFEKSSAKYVKVVAKNFGIIPSWHSGRGKTGYLFIDEIIID